MVASIGEPVNGRRALATIRSALYHAKEKPLHFHLFVDQAGHEDMESVLREWLEPELHRRIAKISWYGPAEFPRIWQILHARVPAECMEGAGWVEGRVWLTRLDEAFSQKRCLRKSQITLFGQTLVITFSLQIPPSFCRSTCAW